uniref:fatty acid amide hydrolase n=1 Tax=Plectus sambesii TaxID=2011161 RepID=A0A914WZM9_9BILA
MPSKTELHALISAQQQKRQQGFDVVRTLLDRLAPSDQEKWDGIRQMSYTQLAAALKDESVAPIDALHAYQEAAINAHEQTNCLVEVLEEAERWAREVELKYKGADKPPLYGMPISLKEQIHVDGHTITFGYANLLSTSVQGDAVVVEVLKEQGAIPFARTNIPQTLMIYSCSNPIYGKTTHPLDSDRTPGGSSGGEAALLAARGSPVGIGTDGGGSVRIPSSFCGLAGIKLTSTRVSQCRIGEAIPGCKGIGISWGPMALEVNALTDVVRAVLNSPTSNLRDPYTPLMPFREDLFRSEKPLTIGWYDFDGWWHALPVMKRAVAETRAALEARGHKLVPWTPPRVKDALRYFCLAFSPDGGRRMLELVDEGVVDPMLRQYFFLYRIPIWVKRTIATLTNWWFPRLAYMNRLFTESSYDLRIAYGQADEYKREFIQSWQSAGLDAVLCPAFGHPAPPHDLPSQCSGPITYTGLYNLLDFSAGVVRVTEVTNKDQEDCAKLYTEEDMFYRMAKAAFTSGSVGLPVGVQCVALPNQDEICLRLMSEVEKTVAPRP